MAADLEESYPAATVMLIESAGGAFEVTVDEQVVFSKKTVGRHAESGEVLKAIEAL